MTSLVACKTCSQVHAMEPVGPGRIAECARCGATLVRRTRGGLHMTAAFALAALILFVPANVLPILRMEKLGRASDNTIWQGCVALYQDGQWGIALIVFLASIAIPLLKLLALFFLVGTTMVRASRGRRVRTRLYQFVERIGRWAMLDVFALAILVSLVKLGTLARVMPGEGLASFGGVVVFTLLASASFDPQLIWEDEGAAP
jgi:paraquat-inducible protein A